MKPKTELEAQYAWQRKGKKYKTKYFSALGQLWGNGSIGDAKEGEPASHTERRSGTDCAGELAHKAGD